MFLEVTRQCSLAEVLCVFFCVQTKGGQRIPKQVKTLELQMNFGAVESVDSAMN
jgi:hypothetical protein